MPSSVWWVGGGILLVVGATACGPESIVLEHGTGGGGARPSAGSGGGRGGIGASQSTGGAGATASSTGGTAGRGTTGGTGGGGTTGGAPSPTPLAVPECPDYAPVLTLNCADVGCHQGRSSASGLDLTPNDTLAARLKDVPAQFGDIYCADAMDYCRSVPAACPTGALLVDSANWEQSWMIAKLRGTSTGCGDPMPPVAFGSDDEICLENLVQRIAELP